MKRSSALTIDSEVFTRGVETIIGRDELSRALREKRPLRIKLGIDATAPGLHIGHAVILWKLRELQEHGHRVQIILGDFTTRIGDPTGKSKTRPVIPRAEIERNVRTIRKEIGKILLGHPRVLEVRRNSEWFGKMRLAEFLQILSLVTHARLIERDMFQERMKRGEEIHLHELLYPVLQGYDSHVLKSDCTIVGSDQLFNEAMGRFFQEKFGGAPQAIVTVRLLPGLDGKEKMSKSAGNYIALADSPQEKFGKAMSLTDSLVLDYLTLYTAESRETIEAWREQLQNGKNPMEAKRFFAESLVSRYHGAVAARRARERFVSLFSKKEIPGDIPGLRIPAGHHDLLELVLATGAVSSKSEARRLIGGGAVEVDGKVLRFSGEQVSVSRGTTIRIGKKRFFRVA